jgi:putative ABC transport system permease protein
LNINTVQNLDQLRAKYLAADQARFQFTATTALLIIVLSALGLFGIQHYQVLSRRREYAMRAAVGASAISLMRSVIGYGFALALPGLVAGTLIGSLAVIELQNSGILSHRLPLLEIGLTVAVGLVLLVLSASVGPAWLAAHRAPAQVLREE